MRWEQGGSGRREAPVGFTQRYTLRPETPVSAPVGGEAMSHRRRYVEGRPCPLEREDFIYSGYYFKLSIAPRCGIGYLYEPYEESLFREHPEMGANDVALRPYLAGLYGVSLDFLYEAENMIAEWVRGEETP